MAENLENTSEEEIISEEELTRLAEHNIPLNLLKDIASLVPRISRCYSLELKEETLIFYPDHYGNYHLLNPSFE
jgi:hypothetical protein